MPGKTTDSFNVSLREDCTLSGLSCFSIFLKLAQKPTRALLFHKHLVCGLNDVTEDHGFLVLVHFFRSDLEGWGMGRGDRLRRTAFEETNVTTPTEMSMLCIDDEIAFFHPL